MVGFGVGGCDGGYGGVVMREGNDDVDKDENEGNVLMNMTMRHRM